MVEFVLGFVVQRGIEVGYPQSREGPRLSRPVGNLIGPIRYAAHEGQAAGGIDHCREVEKSFFLRRAVVDRFIGRRWIFYSEIASKIAPGHEILGLSDRAAIFETRCDGAVAAAIDTRSEE